MFVEIYIKVSADLGEVEHVHKDSKTFDLSEVVSFVESIDLQTFDFSEVIFANLQNSG